MSHWMAFVACRDAESKAEGLTSQIADLEGELERVKAASGEAEAAAKLKAAETEIAALKKKLENEAIVQVRFLFAVYFICLCFRASNSLCLTPHVTVDEQMFSTSCPLNQPAFLWALMVSQENRDMQTDPPQHPPAVRLQSMKTDKAVAVFKARRLH